MNELIALDQEIIKKIISIRDNYQYEIRHFIKWITETGNSVNEKGIREYFVFLNNSDYSANTIRNKRQAVKKRIRQLTAFESVEEQLKVDRILKNIDREGQTKAPTVNSEAIGESKVLSPIEYREMLIRARSNRQKAFIRFLW